MAIEKIDWANLNYTKTSLAYLLKDQELLLIEKKTGLGKGKVLGPGGKLESGENFKEAVIREIEEEVGLNLCGGDLEERGDLYFFQRRDGITIWNKVFVGRAPAHQKPKASLEAQPFWCKLWQLPFEKMWKDDYYWLLALLSGSYVQACFLMEGEKVAEAYTELSSQVLKSLHLRSKLKEA